MQCLIQGTDVTGVGYQYVGAAEGDEQQAIDHHAEDMIEGQSRQHGIGFMNIFGVGEGVLALVNVGNEMFVV